MPIDPDGLSCSTCGARRFRSRADLAWHEAEHRKQEKAMGPDHSRTGIFVNHNCPRCLDGKKPCVKGNPNRCGWLHARND